MDKKLIELHHALIEVYCEYSYINSGGCGVVAGIIGEYLARTTDVRIVVAAYDYNVEKQELSFSDIKTLLPTDPSINNWEQYGVHFNHVWVEFLYKNKWYSVDTENISDDADNMYSHWEPYQERISVETINQLSNNTEGWNWLFDRAQIPSIKRALNKKLKAINL